LPKLNTISKKRKDENIELKAQKLFSIKNKKQNLLLYFITTIAFGIALFIYYFLSVKNKREKIKPPNTESAEFQKITMN
jgi:hypothetical protein